MPFGLLTLLADSNRMRKNSEGHRASHPARLNASTVRTINTLWVALMVLGCGAAAPEAGPEAGGPTARATEVQAALQASIDAWERADIEALQRVFAPEAVIYDPSPPGEWRGSDAIRAFMVEFFDQNQEIAIDLRDVRVRTAGPVGWTTSRYVFSWSFQGARNTVEGYLTMIWVKQPDDAYRATLFHASRLPEDTGS